MENLPNSSSSPRAFQRHIQKVASYQAMCLLDCMPPGVVINLRLLAFFGMLKVHPYDAPQIQMDGDFLGKTRPSNTN